MPLPQIDEDGQVVMTPLQFKVVAVTLHGGCGQVNTCPFGQSSSHPVRAWLVWLSFAS